MDKIFILNLISVGKILKIIVIRIIFRWNLEKIGIWDFLIIELLTFKVRFFVLIFRNVLILKFGFFLSWKRENSSFLCSKLIWSAINYSTDRTFSFKTCLSLWIWARFSASYISYSSFSFFSCNIFSFFFNPSSYNRLHTLLSPIFPFLFLSYLALHYIKLVLIF